jgi:hypothetical protein
MALVNAIRPKLEKIRSGALLCVGLAGSNFYTQTSDLHEGSLLAPAIFVDKVGNYQILDRYGILLQARESDEDPYSPVGGVHLFRLHM